MWYGKGPTAPPPNRTSRPGLGLRLEREAMDNPEESFAPEHTPAGVRARLSSPPRPSYLRDFVYGAIDGAVTTFAIVAGVVGAGLSDSVIVILGFANLFADGFSMAASNFLGTRAEQQRRQRARAEEERQIELFAKHIIPAFR